jgi:hypothetical protein
MVRETISTWSYYALFHYHPGNYMLHLIIKKKQLHKNGKFNANEPLKTREGVP